MRHVTRRLALAAVATLCAMAAPPLLAQYMHPALGRLFTTPDERIRLDRDRVARPALGAEPAPPAPAAAETAAPVAAPPAAPARLTGVVRRSDGRATVWVDDQPRETTLPRLRAGSAIPVDTDGGRVLVKPGQSYIPADGTISDPR